jgi:hypothetical protein
MKFNFKLALALAGVGAAALAGSPAAAEAPSPWVHIRVEEPGRDSKVSVNLPLSVVHAALKAAPEHVASHGRIHLGIGHEGLSIADFRRLWSELKAAGDADLVQVEQADENVTIARKGELVQVHVQKPKGDEEVWIEVPVSLVDALLATDGDELDVRGALEQLKDRRGEIVRVKDKDSSVRIWIDER